MIPFFSLFERTLKNGTEDFKIVAPPYHDAIKLQDNLLIPLDTVSYFFFFLIEGHQLKFSYRY